MNELIRKLLFAQKQMVLLKGTPAHEEQKKIVREYEQQIRRFWTSAAS